MLIIKQACGKGYHAISQEGQQSVFLLILAYLTFNSYLSLTYLPFSQESRLDLILLFFFFWSINFGPFYGRLSWIKFCYMHMSIRSNEGYLLGNEDIIQSEFMNIMLNMQHRTISSKQRVLLEPVQICNILVFFFLSFFTITHIPMFLSWVCS